MCIFTFPRNPGRSVEGLRVHGFLHGLTGPSNHDQVFTRLSSCDEMTREKSGIKAKRSQPVSKTKKYKRQAVRVSFQPSVYAQQVVYRILNMGHAEKGVR